MPSLSTSSISRYPTHARRCSNIMAAGIGLSKTQLRNRRNTADQEKVVIQQSKQQKALHTPVKDCQGRCTARPCTSAGSSSRWSRDTVPIEHFFLPQPPVEVADDRPIHHRQGQRLTLPRCRPPRAVLGKAGRSGCGQRQRCAVGIRPVDELLREQLARAGGRVQHAEVSIGSRI